MRRLTFMTIFLAAASAASLAAEPPGRLDAEALAKTIAPFIDEQTLLVVHADLTRIDPNAAVDRFARLAGPLPAEQQCQIGAAKAMAGGILRHLLAAGARDAFLVVSLADVPEEPLLIVVPLRQGADERAIRGLLYSGRPDGPTSRPDGPPGQGHARTQVTVLRGAVVRCNVSVLRRVEAMKPDLRSDLAKAFAAAGDSAIQAVLLPTDDNRRVLEEMMPELPKEAGGGPITAITKGLLWAALGINGPPKASLRLVIQSADADSAQAFAKALDGIYAAIAAHKEVLHDVPEVGKLLTALRPTPSGDRLVLDLGPQAVDELLDGPVASAIRQAMKKQPASQPAKP